MLCTHCSVDLPDTEFYHNKGRVGRCCKGCYRVLQRDFYQRNRAAELARTKKNRKRRSFEVRVKYLEYLRQHPCVDCGESDPVVLDADHVGDNKTWNVSQLVGRGRFSWDRAITELAKCEIRCSNCHRKKTAKRQSWFKCQEFLTEGNG